ncbi:GspH/FimT family pseudopilin [Spiribacter halobius]|uniref:Type II secretion system protein H n=1 Tax=Sediminicurvatus halobius TaxID=2182432 RepID=A0A2U2N845_9GAMM|nr:GspH/FimT family pseudopilin [Spiribacter halobius]PWG65272.1 hypothetical protein DEM34_02355 [Spiribacter halobius]UEX78910.1 GspH/FimT family pseudopilin [Spiribacter halobius]
MTRTGGFTLVELMVTLAVAAILLSVGVPSFQALIRDNRLTGANNELVTAINAARSEAVRQGVTMTLCASTDASSCGGSDWDGGWLLFADADGDGTRDASESILRSQASAPTGVAISTTGFGSAGAIQYMASGFIAGADEGSFVFCDDRGAGEARAINLNASGRPSQALDQDGDGVVENHDGNAVSC